MIEVNGSSFALKLSNQNPCLPVQHTRPLSLHGKEHVLLLDLRDLCALYAKASHQPFLIEEECIDV